MKITIHYHAQSRLAAGRALEVIDIVESITLKQLICRVADKHGQPLRAMLLSDVSGPNPSLLLFVDEEQVRSDSNRPLSDGAEVIIFSPIAGG